MTISIDGNGTITGASTLATTVVSPTLTTPNINSAQFATVTGTAPIYPCRAWVNFNGTGTVAIRASGNVSSITDNGTGNYIVNFTTAMFDSSFAAVSATSNDGVVRTDLPTIASVRVVTSTAAADASIVSVSIFR
jgi:hypothetical protein